MNFELLKNEPMSEHTTFRTGGIAEEYYRIYNADGLMEVLEKCWKAGEEPLIIGNGSNLLISDKGPGVPVIEIGEGLSSIVVDGDYIEAEAGVMLSKVARAALDSSLTGMEFASGIPGSVGGALYMNAGAYGGEMKDITESVKVYKDGIVIDIPAEEMKFGYRYSKAMDDHMIILGGRFKLEKGDRIEIEDTMNDLNKRRRDKQPLEYPSAGSTFKRPEGYFAGKLIMDSGLAGKSVGGAVVSPKHCGFIINKGGATSTDIYNLICEVQDIVYKKYGVRLETEVKLIGDFQ